MVFSRIAAETLRVLPRKSLSRALGSLASWNAPRAAVQASVDLYARAYGIDLEDYVVPEAGWSSFNEFFIRELAAGRRPVSSDPLSVISPADGTLQSTGLIEQGATLRVKGQTYSVGALLARDSDAARFEGGTFAVIYLSPRDYHRVHAPVDGTVECVRHVPGTLFPVNEIGSRYVRGLLARNERVAVFQRSDVHGEVVSILVGALGVGSIDLAFDSSVRTHDGPVRGSVRYPVGRAPVLSRGAEMGRFRVGSTVIVLTTANAMRVTREQGVRIRMGEVLGMANSMNVSRSA